jgi:hypothetical protein
VGDDDDSERVSVSDQSSSVSLSPNKIDEDSLEEQLHPKKVYPSIEPEKPG